MGTYFTSMPVYRDMKILRSYLYDIVCRLPRDLKHPLGTKINEELFLTVRYLAGAAIAPEVSEKVKCCNAFLFEYAVLKDQVEFLIEKRAISLKQGAYILTQMEGIERQLGGLRKHLQGGGQNSRSKE